MVDTPADQENTANLIKNIHGNPFLAKEVYGLWSGSMFDRNEQIPETIVDISRIESIVGLNSFF